jgi:hypothetical protein
MTNAYIIVNLTAKGVIENIARYKKINMTIVNTKLDMNKNFEKYVRLYSMISVNILFTDRGNLDKNLILCFFDHAQVSLNVFQF